MNFKEEPTVFTVCTDKCMYIYIHTYMYQSFYFPTDAQRIAF